MENEYVPLRDLPDLCAGDLMLLQEHDRPERILWAPRARGCQWLSHPSGSIDHVSRQGAANGQRWGWDQDATDRVVRVVRYLRGVTGADLADDRWPETERRLREAINESAQRAPLKVGDVVSANQINELPVGAVLPQPNNIDGEYCMQRTAVGWRNVAWDWDYGPDAAMGVSGCASPRQGRLLALGCDADERVALARQMAAAGIEPAAKWLQHHGLSGKLGVGDRVTAEQIATLPPGAVVRRDLGDVWQIGPNQKARPTLLRTSDLPRLLEFAAFNSTRGGTIIALDAPLADDRRALLEHVAAAGDEEARQALQAAVQAAAPKAKARPPLKPGDRVEGRWDELPPGSVVDTKDGSRCPLMVRGTGAGRWSWATLTDPDQAGPAYWDGSWRVGKSEYPDGVFVGCVPVQADGEPFVRALADQGYEPARKALGEAKAAEPEQPVVRVGDGVTDWSRLPDGAVVAASDTKELALYRDGKRMWIRTGHGHWYQSVGGWCDASASWSPTISGHVVALCPADCTPAQAREIVERLESTHAPKLKVGDDVALTRDAWNALPPNTLVRLTRGPRYQSNYGHVRALGDRRFRYVNESGVDVGGASPWAVDDIKSATVVALDAPVTASEVAAIISRPQQDGFAEATQAQFDPLPVPGDRIGRAKAAQLPAGSVVEVGHGALDAPPPGPALRAWCAARGYEPAVTLEREIAAEEARKQIVDAEPAAVHTEQMAMQSITIEVSGVKCAVTQNPGEEQSVFLTRVADVKRALCTAPAQAAQSKPLVFDSQTTPSALARIGSALGQIGGDFAKDALSAVVDQKALALVDVSRVGGGKAVVALAELFGDKAALKALRAVQSPLAPVVVDGVVAVGASLLGARGLAQVTRGRFVRRVVEGTGEAIVERGVGVVTQLAQTVGALAAAATSAAELTEGAADAQVEKVEG